MDGSGLNAGSVTTAPDDWEANNAGGRIVVNDGTHSSGTGTGHNVGAQGSSSKIGCGIDFRGGTVTAGNFRFQINSTSSVGGSAVLASAGSSTTFSDDSGTINILSGWTGSWTVGSFGAGEWESRLTDPANGFKLDSGAINAAMFADRFSVSVDGKTLTMNPEVTAVTLTLSGPVSGNMELTWEGNVGVAYTIETNSNLTIPTGWNTFMTTNGAGSITVTAPATADETFYRVIGE